MLHGIEQSEKLPGAFVLSHEREGHRSPNGAVSVLAAILAHTGNVAFDVAGIERRFIKGGIEKLDEFGVATNKALIDGVHSLTRALRVAGAADYRPALRQRIDLAFEVCLRAERFAVVEIGAPIPLAVPRIFLDVFLQLFRLGQATLRETHVLTPARHFSKLPEHIAKKKG